MKQDDYMLSEAQAMGPKYKYYDWGKVTLRMEEWKNTQKRKRRRKLCKVALVITLVLLSILMSSMLVSCATPKNTERNTQMDLSGALNWMQKQIDSLAYNMRSMRKETSEKLSNMKVKNETVYLSPPDSTGKQYPTAISKTKANKEEKENKTIDTKIEVTMQQLVKEMSELKEKLDAAVNEKEKVVEVSWWQLHKMDVYTGSFAVIIVIYLVYKRKK